MAKRGAKSKYESLVKPYLKDINDKVRQGITEAEIAKALGISVATLNNYKKYDEFADALKKDKGADILNELVNSGVESAKGYWKDVTTITSKYKMGVEVERNVTTQRVWFPPNPTLHKFYVLNFGKKEGYVNDPLEYEAKKEKQDLEIKILKEKNWDKID